MGKEIFKLVAITVLGACLVKIGNKLIDKYLFPEEEKKKEEKEIKNEAGNTKKV